MLKIAKIESKIPNAIQEIIDAYISRSFESLTYKQLSDQTRVEKNTLVQRINRNLNYFRFIGDRPKLIELNSDLEEIYIYRDKNQCQICEKIFKPDELHTREKDPYRKKKKKQVDEVYDWENVITCCSHCKEKDLVKRLELDPKKLSLGRKTWEYKEITIRRPYKRINSTSHKFGYVNYMEFNEDNGPQWYHVLDNENDICNSKSEILNFFGNRGWDLINIEEETDYDLQPTGVFQYLFKREKIEGD